MADDFVIIEGKGDMNVLLVMRKGDDKVLYEARDIDNGKFRLSRYEVASLFIANYCVIVNRLFRNMNGE